MTATDTSISDFRASFTGTVLVDGDEGYDEARKLWNGDIDRRPAIIAQCADATQVASAIRHARDQGLDIAVRGGGHNFAGHGVCEGGLMIDLSVNRSVVVDPAAKQARCAGGTTWADLDAATQEHGLAVPGGVISHTGVAGLTLGGGIGWLSRRAGLSCDNLVGATMVTAAGEIVHASADENTDLHWALRGGGGNFGVVTEFEFALTDVGPLVNLGMFFWTIDKAADALRFARDYIDQLPHDVGVQLVGLNAPPAPFVPEEFVFQPGLALMVVTWGSPEEHAPVIAPVQTGMPPTFEFVTPIPYTALQQMIDESAPWGILGYEKAIYLDDLTDEAAGVVISELAKKSSPMSIMPIFPLGGRYAEVAEGDTAFGGSRSAKWLVNIAAIAPEPALLDADRAWVRAFWDALRPFASGSGTYVNFLNDADEDRLRASYGPDKYDRLARIKTQYDPDNTFHMNANIKPATPAPA
jgi:hypothetical protein